jgi:tetratricopeptide (TPR) repeat protein
LGLCYFNLKEYDFANHCFNDYLSCQSQPEYFEEAICYKLEIANRFRMGAKKRFFGTKALPKWAPGRSHAVEIYNEVVAAIPCHNYAAQALWGKAHLHWEDLDFRECIETLQQLIRRFPSHELTACAYIAINQAYLDQANCEFQNPDILVLAQINARKFASAFPKDERVADAEADVQAIKELYAKGLFDTAQFFERTEKPQASILYYRRAIEKFPDTAFAKCSRHRLRILGALEALCDPS